MALRRLIGLGAVLLAGCAAPSRSYVAPRLLVEATQGELEAAVFRNIMNQDWRLLARDTQTGCLEAVSGEQRSDRKESRLRWSFAVNERQIRIRVLREQRSREDSTDPWRTSTLVSAEYDYALERAQLRLILAMLDLRDTSEFDVVASTCRELGAEPWHRADRSACLVL